MAARVKADLNLLRILVELYDLGSVGLVAKSLRQSQPSISVALKKLRVIFNDPLFVRTLNGMAPTQRATAVIGSIRESLARIDDQLATEIAFDEKTARNTFTFALSDIGEPLILPLIAQAIGNSAPNASMHVVAPSIVAIERGLERGDINLALGYRPDLKRSNYYQQRLFSSDYACLMRVDHALKNDRLDVGQFLDFRHVMLRADNRAQEELEEFFRRRHMKRNIWVQTPHIYSIPLLIVGRDLIATMPSFIAHHMAELDNRLKVVVPTFNVPVVDVKQYWHRRFHKEPANQWLRQVVAKACHFRSVEAVRIPAVRLPTK